MRGLRARALPLVDAASITNIATGKRVVDNGPPDRRGANDDQVISGRIAALLHGKRGEVNGALLDDGTTLRLPPPEAERLQDQLRQGQTVSARGDVLDTALGKVIDVRAIGASPEQMTELRGPRPPGPEGWSQGWAGSSRTAAASRLRPAPAAARLMLTRTETHRQDTNMHWIDPDSLPEVTGIFERFVLNPHGEVDGFVMKDKQATILVHTPPHMDGKLTRHISPRRRIRVRGVRPRGAELLAAVAVTTAKGRQIIDDGPDHDRKHPKVKHEPMTTDGTVRMSLFGPKGELRGALLSDGTVLRVGPKEAEHFAALLAPGSEACRPRRRPSDQAWTRHPRDGDRP